MPRGNARTIEVFDQYTFVNVDYKFVESDRVDVTAKLFHSQVGIKAQNQMIEGIN